MLCSSYIIPFHFQPCNSYLRYKLLFVNLLAFFNSRTREGCGICFLRLINPVLPFLLTHPIRRDTLLDFDFFYINIGWTSLTMFFSLYQTDFIIIFQFC